MAEILVSSLISDKTKGPRIDITLNGVRVQLSAMEARDLMNNINQCIAAAESDAFLFHFVTEELHQKPEVGGEIIRSFRDYRDKMETDWKNDDYYKKGNI